MVKPTWKEKSINGKYLKKIERRKGECEVLSVFMVPAIISQLPKVGTGGC
jgi:hypothetical protein